MRNYLAQWMQLMALAQMGFTDADGNEAPPTREEREKAATTLRSVEDGLAVRNKQVQDSTRTLTFLDKNIAEMEKLYDPMAKEAEALAQLARQRQEEARRNAAEAEAAAALAAQAQAAQEQVKAAKTLLDNFKEQQRKAKEATDKGTLDTNRLQSELKTALDTFFRTADPQMIGERYGKPFNGNFSFDVNPAFMQRTQIGAPNTVLHYGMGAEHTWDDNYSINGSGPLPIPFLSQTITLKSITQHEQVTTRMMFDTATQLLQRYAPGMQAPVAHFGMNVNDGDFRTHNEAYKGVFGHPVDAFRPTVINNSTTSTYSLEDNARFRAYMDAFTRGPGTVSIKADNGTATYGLPDLGQPIVGNASGNKRWGRQPDPSGIKNFHPNHMNIGVSTTPALPDAALRDEAAPSHIEEYSTQNSGVHAVIQRPRWNQEGKPYQVQYLNPGYERIVEENLWRLTGHARVPKPEELFDTAKFSPALIKAMEADKANLLDLIRRREGVNPAGIHSNLEGTSFAAPVAGGVILAASILYPDASQAELMDAFCSSCRPITHRFVPGGSERDITYLIEPRKGRIYSPMVGFGEFVLDGEATRRSPDSWLRMLDRLEAMKQARDDITDNGRRRTEIDVGEGANKRSVLINGQPQPVTLELTKGRPFESQAMQNQAERVQNRVLDALTDIDRYNDSSIAVGSTELVKLVRSRQYEKARDMLRNEVKGKITGENDPYYKAAEEALKDAIHETGHCYSFTVRKDQDALTTMTALRLKYPEGIDRHIILESPDGTRIPMTVCDERLGVVVTSTPGFMRKPAAGEWRLYTVNPVDIAQSTLVINGTERNLDLGIIDVREQELTRIEKREARHRDLPPENIMPPIGSPFTYIHDMTSQQALPLGPVRVIAPSTREQFQEQMQKFIEGSELRKGGFIPEGAIEKVSMRDPLMPRSRETQLDEIGAMLANAGVIPFAENAEFKLPAHLRKAEPAQEKRGKLAIG